MADCDIRSVGNPVRDARELVGAAMTAMMQGEPGSEVEQTRAARATPCTGLPAGRPLHSPG